MSFSLGDFEFVTASRQIGEGVPPLVLMPMSEIRQRPGADGTDLRHLGVKGVPFEYFTFIDCDDTSAAHALFADYRETAVSGTPLDLVWAGVNYRIGYGTAYQVLAVEVLELRQVAGASGGLSSLKGAYLRCRWQLLPVAMD